MSKNSKKSSGPSLKDLIAGKSDAVARATAEHASKKMAEQLKAQLKKGKAAKASAPRASAPRKEKESRVTVASRIRELIAAGKDNEAVWTIAKKEFRLPDSKKHYPSWYRCEMQRKKIAVRKAAKKAA